MSYVRSEARGNLNDFNTYFGNQKHPVLRPDEYGKQTNHSNPRDVQNNIDAGQFGTFYNSAGRSVRLKFEFVKY